MVWQLGHIRQTPSGLTPTRLSFSHLATPSQRKPNIPLSITQLPHSATPAPPPVSLFLIPRSPKIKPGHRLPGMAVRARKTPLQHKSLRQARVLSPKDPQRSQLLNVVSLPPVPPQPSRNHSFIITATLPDIMAAVLREANCSLPLSLTASVNGNGAVTLIANPYIPSSAYSPSFDAMTKKLNQSFLVGDPPFQVFREAATSVVLLINNLPLSILPHEPTDLFP